MSNWIKILNSLPAHPKILRAGDRAAWLFVCGLCYANEHLTDGYLAREVLVVAAPGVKAPERLASALVDVGLWDEVEGGWQVHDYGDYQRTSQQVKDTRRKDRERKVSTESNRIPDGIPTDSESKDVGIPSRVRAAAPSQEKKREEENNPPTPQASVEFEGWCLHYEQTTGHSLPARSTKAFKSVAESYAARLAEGYSADDLQLATVGAHGDEWRRTNGYDVAESILRPTKIASLIAKGKLRSGGGANGPKSSAELAELFRGGAA